MALKKPKHQKSIEDGYDENYAKKKISKKDKRPEQPEHVPENEPVKRNVVRPEKPDPDKLEAKKVPKSPMKIEKETIEKKKMANKQIKSDDDTSNKIKNAERFRKSPPKSSVEDATIHSSLEHSGPKEALDAPKAIQWSSSYATEQNESEDAMKKLSFMHMASFVVLIASYTVVYMDWYSFFSVREIVNQFYQLEGDDGIIFHNSFNFIFAVMSPVFGYIGDRMKRKTLMLAGMILWFTANVSSSFVPKTNFLLFLLLRIAFTIGQCCFCILLQSVIADMFHGNKRLKAFSFVYLAVPVGGGIGFLCGRFIPRATGHWQYVFIYTCPLSMFLVIAIFMTMTEPIRRKVESAEKVKNTGICNDLKYLTMNKTFLLSTSASICLNCVSSFAKVWLPIFMHRLSQKRNPYSSIEETMTMVSLVFTLGGMTGIILQYQLVTSIGRASTSLEVIVAGVMCFCAAPLLYLLVMIHTFRFFSWCFFFLCSATMIGNWAFKMDLIMSTVIPQTRTLAVGLHEFASQIFGETIAAYLVAMAGGLLRKDFESQSIWLQIRGFQNIIVLPCAICCIAGGAFIFDYFYLEKERQALFQLTVDKHPETERKKDQSSDVPTEI